MAHTHVLDTLSLGKIVQIRERLLKAQASGAKVFRFESGDPDFSVFPHVLKALQDAATAGKTHYIPNNGIPELRTALRKKLESKNKIVLPSDAGIFVTNGAMHALFVTFSALLDEGDEVIVPDPMWTEVVENIRLAKGIPVPVPLRPQSDFQYVPAEILARITNKTKAIFLNTPHNPTGAMLSAETLRKILEIAKERNLWIISDEAYEDVVYAPQVHHSIASLDPSYLSKIVSIFSFSKSYAMSGLRIGYLATTSEMLIDRLPKLLRCSINGVNSVAQWTALAAITGDQAPLQNMVDEYAVRRDIMLEGLKDIPGVHPFVPQGSFFAWVELEPEIYRRLGVADADGLSQWLAAKGIGSAPGDAFGKSCENAIRFAFSCSTKMVKEGVPVLRQALLGELT
jgi:aspartate aminotransferase